MAAVADVGTGITVVFGTSGFAMNIMNVSGPSMSRESLETTHQGTTTARTFVPSSLYDGGEVTLDLQYDPDIAVPISGAVETVTITWPSADTSAFSAFVTSFEPTANLEEIEEATCTLKVTGEVTTSSSTDAPTTLLTATAA